MYVIATCQGEYIFDLTPSSHHIFVKVSTPPYAPQLCQSMKLIAALSVEIILNSVLCHSESSAFNYHLFHLSELIITMIFQDLDFSRCVQWFSKTWIDVSKTAGLCQSCPRLASRSLGCSHATLGNPWRLQLWSIFRWWLGAIIWYRIQEQLYDTGPMVQCWDLYIYIYYTYVGSSLPLACWPVCSYCS